MKYTAKDIRIDIRKLSGHSEKDCIASKLKLDASEKKSLAILRRSLDSRFHGSKGIFYSYTVSYEGKKAPKTSGVTPYSKKEIPEIIPEARFSQLNPVIVGSGPAGLFCALRLVAHGATPIIIEAGKDIEERKLDVEALMEENHLNAHSNVQFGLGGAGTFSDGKLRTRIKSPLTGYVLNSFVDFGASRDILWEAKPHIGTDKLTGVISAMKEYLKSKGALFMFSSRLTGISIHNGMVKEAIINDRDIIPASEIILCPGNAARNTFKMLDEAQVMMEAKPISVGVRVEHSKRVIDEYNYGEYAGNPLLPTADCTLTYKDSSGRGVYTFCSCPGGYVINSSTEPGGLCVNGMSYSQRDNFLTNSAFVVSVSPKDYPSSSPLGGIDFQRMIERKAFIAGGSDYCAPITTMGDFLGMSTTSNCEPTIRPGFRYSSMEDIFPDYIINPLKYAFSEFCGRIRGFSSGMITACETRTSSPVRILRDPSTNQSLNIKGLYPAGEGAGYAGGIMSSAVDGVACADMVIRKYT